MEKLRGLVVDDTVVYRKILTQAVEATGLCQVVKTAPNGSIALDWMDQKSFDVVLLDVFMPEMDGLETLKLIKERHPNTEVIMVSSDGNESVKNTVKALELGALEFILKPSGGDHQSNLEAITRMLKIFFTQIQIKQMRNRPSGLHQDKEDSPKAVPQSPALPRPSITTGRDNRIVKPMGSPHRKPDWKQADLVVIAASTGGPVALEKVLSPIGKPLDIPMLIVQHMPKNFTRVLATSLNQKSGLHVLEAQNGMVIEPGKAIIAAGGYHMELEEAGGKKVLKLVETEYVNGVRPAADVTFASLAHYYRNQRILVVVLTGMGSDATKGVTVLSEQSQVYTITQNEDTCVVYGMPRSIDEAGLSHESLPIEQIAARIESFGLRRR